MGEAEVAAAQDGIVLRLGVVIVAVAPGADARRVVADVGVGVGIEQPERHIHALDLGDAVFAAE